MDRKPRHLINIGPRELLMLMKKRGWLNVEEQLELWELREHLGSWEELEKLWGSWDGLEYVQKLIKVRCRTELGMLRIPWELRKLRIRREMREVKNKQIKPMLTFKTKSKGENWATALGWFIPRKYRDDIIGDILEDCGEMREKGCTERRIKFHVVYQWLIAVLTLVPTAVKTSITDILKQVISPPK